MRRNGIPTPNTNEELRGKKPRKMMADLAFKNHICDRCRSRWVEANVVYCDICIGKINATAAKRVRKNRKLPRMKEKNPFMLEVVIARNLGGKGLDLMVFGDTGNIINVRGVDTVDIRDARAGKAKITGYRTKEKEEKPKMTFTPASSRSQRPKTPGYVTGSRSRRPARVM